MENVYRGDYVECMVAHALGHDWQLTWINGWNWAVWDIEHRTGVRVEVKQSSARQSWDRAAEAPDRQAIARFDIAPRTGYWLKNGGDWIPFQSPSRPADVYVFAWHGERRREFADQSDPAQWRFFVVAESELPCLQKTIGLQVLKRSYSSCRIGELPDAIATAFPNQLEIGAKPPD
ncbi:MAG: hypothetical protein F4X41_00225 [Chloroflexi bacterium]|nr:hypothetical protein [Chloroflexota bacterium]